MMILKYSTTEKQYGLLYCCCIVYNEMEVAVSTITSEIPFFLIFVDRPWYYKTALCR